MKDCAQQMDQFLRDREKAFQRMDQTHAVRLTVMEWKNHYSPKYGRCYAEITSVYKAPEGSSAWYDELHDAFENRLVATCVPAFEKTTNRTCTVNSRNAQTEVDCDACRQFIDDHMRN